MSADIVAFLTARYDEIEAAAKAATLGPWHALDGGVVSDDEAQWPVCCHPASDRSREDRVHIALHDPAYVLADIAAKRRIVGLHQPDRTDGYQECTTCADPPAVRYDEASWQRWPCPTLCALTAPFAAHPDYDPSWSVEP